MTIVFLLRKNGMLFTILFLLLVLFLIGLLFIPIQIYVDTNASECFVKLKGLAKASLEPDEKELLRIRLKVLFFERCFYPIREYPKKKKKAKKQKSKRKRKISAEMIFRLLKSFKVKRFVLDVDTGDYVTNAKLYPVFVLLNQFVAPFHINFQDRNILVVDVRNRPYHILKSFINN